MDERKKLRSGIWFDDHEEPGEAAVYLERYGNYGITRGELQSGRPIIGIAQSGSGEGWSGSGVEVPHETTSKPTATLPSEP